MDSGGFKKKRQNVIGISLVLYFLEITEKRLDRIKILDVEFTIVHEYAMYIFWILFFYFLYRLVIAWVDTELSKFEEEYREFIWGGLNGYGARRFLEELNDQEVVHDEKELLAALKRTFIEENLLRDKNINFSFEVDYTKVEKRTGKFIAVEKKDKKVRFNYLDIGLRWAVFRRFLIYLVINKHSSEYLLPLVFTLATLALLSYKLIVAIIGLF